MKKFIIVASALLMAFTAGAQNYVNLGYGLPTSIMKFGDTKPEGLDGNAFALGYSHNINLTRVLGLEVGVNGVYQFYNTKDEFLDTKAETKSNYLGAAAPVLLNVKFDMGSVAFKFLAGATCNYGFMDKVSTYLNGVKQLTLDNYEDPEIRRFGVSASAAVAAEWASVFRFKIGFDYGITDLDKSSAVKSTVNMLSFSLGYMF